MHTKRRHKENFTIKQTTLRFVQKTWGVLCLDFNTIILQKREMSSYQELGGSESESDYGSVPKSEELDSVIDNVATAAALQTGEPKPKILLMGPRRSGKSSIQKVVFSVCAFPIRCNVY